LRAFSSEDPSSGARVKVIRKRDHAAELAMATGGFLFFDSCSFSQADTLHQVLPLPKIAGTAFCYDML
jgi:hypothetical protein